MQADVIIVGGGIAAITAALDLLSFGQKVLIIERGKAQNFGGMAQWSFGGMFFVNSPIQKRVGIKDSEDLALSDWLSAAEFEPDEVLPRQWAEAYVQHTTPTTFAWLQQQGVQFFPVVHWVERGLFKPGNSVPRFHLVWGTGWELTRRLERQLRQHPKANDNLRIVLEHRVEEIIVQGGQIAGVAGKHESTNADFEYHAPVVVVAAGGVGGNLERVRNNWYKPFGTPPETLLNGLDPMIDGSMIDATEKINGKITHLDRIWCYAAGIHHPQPRHPHHGLSIVPPRSALWLNYKGERIGPEPLVTSFDTYHLVESVCRQDKKMSWQVMNYKIMRKEFAISGSEHNPAIRDKRFFQFVKDVVWGNQSLVDDIIKHCPDVLTANSLGELAEKMNDLQGNNDIDAELMQREIRQYDAMIARGKKFHNDDQLRRIAQVRQYLGDRLRTCNFQRIEDESTKPYIAIREFIMPRKTLGGIQTDLQSRVTQRDSNPNNPDIIPGLYAIGESAGYGGGGMIGKKTLEGAFLGGCVFTGRIAAHSIAGKKLF